MSKRTTVVDLPFQYRHDSIGDVGVVKQIFEDQCYDLRPFRQSVPLIAWFEKQASQPVILDLGANIGASTVFFAHTFPTAHIIAVEPEGKNYDLLAANTAGKRVTTVFGAAHCDDGTLYLSDPGRSDWGFQTSTTFSDIAVRAYSVPSLLKMAPNVSVPFIAKIDIEGAEAALFRRNVEWVSRFPLIIIELHDWMEPGKSTSRNFFRALHDGTWDICIRGENLFCFQIPLLERM